MIMRASVLCIYIFLFVAKECSSFVASKNAHGRDTSLSMGLFGGESKIPTSAANRDKLAIDSIKAAISKPKNPSFPLVECEFPPLADLNKLGDGSLRSTNQANEANLSFAAKLVRSISPLPIIGPDVILMLSSSTSQKYLSQAKKVAAGASYVGSLTSGLPDSFKKGDVVIILCPSSQQDYLAANKMATDGMTGGVVLVNGLFKDPKSVSSQATMAYFLKPLTYNSQVVGYLARNYPNDWATIDVLSKQLLGSYKDEEILFGESNTPDLRGPGRLVQKCVDERAILSRKK